MGDRRRAVGLTTVVFVDVEGSTALLQRVGDESGLASIRRQLDTVRARVAAYGGIEVKSLGDGLLVTFASPRQAVSFALASQRALAGSLPRVRFGINTGEAVDLDTDVHGSAVNAAARISGRAAGGEVLVSDVVRQLVGGTAPTIRFSDRGRCRLRGFAERWHLWIAEDNQGEGFAPATIGRVAELTTVADVVASTSAGVGRVVVVEGEAGIGKTQLVREAASRARRAELSLVEVTADEVVRRPGVVAHGLLNATRRSLHGRTRLDELLNARPSSPPGGEDLSYAIVEASVDLVEELARIRPVLLAAEDLHWADDLSLAVLIAFVRRAGVSRFGVVGSLRPSPRPTALDRLLELVHHGLGVHIRLGSLDEVDVHALASAQLGAAPGPRLCERLRATSGNPLYVTELLRSLDDDGLLRVDAGVVDVTQGAMPANLNETLVRRLSWLPSETIELLRLASLLGGAFTLGDLAAITRRPVIDVAAWLREASLAGLIVGDRDRLAFRHDLIRDAVYGYMLPAERRDLHRAAGQALADAGAPTQQIAEQFARGALPGDLEAVRWLERAAGETISVSPASAVALFERAVALAPTNWPGRAALQARAIEPLIRCGGYDDAEAIAKALLASSPRPDVEYAALRGLSWVYGGRGDYVAAIAAWERAAAAPVAPADETRLHRCLAATLSMLIGLTTVDDARRLAEEALAEAVAVDDAPTQCFAHQCLGGFAAFSGHVATSQQHFIDSMALLDTGQVVDAATYLIPDLFHALGLLELDSVDEAGTAADQARQRAEEGGAVGRLPMAYVVAALAGFYAGRWDDALTELEAGLAVIDDTGNLNYMLYYEALLAKIAIHRGDLATAESQLKSGTRRLATRAPLLGVDWLVGTQAEYLAATERVGPALTLAATSWEQLAPARYSAGYRGRGIFLVRLAVGAGRDELADAVTVELEKGARRTPAASAVGAALLCRGLVERDPAPALEAMARYRETPLRPDLAVCCEDAARLLAAAGRRDEAVALLHEAAGIHANLDATADTARVDAALTALGVQRPRRRASRPTFGWDSLTPMETQVSTLVAEGLTNPEIGARLYISRRTVETHLSHVFTKLALGGRTQLAAELSKRTMVSPAAPGRS
jgi:class 3 adenylate cyclase/DNA-binding CsgD family transcriptional regulator/tetratricopeptide (TPR) repeat protein